MCPIGKNQDKLTLDTVIRVQNYLDGIFAVMVEAETPKDILALFFVSDQGLLCCQCSKKIS